MSIKKTTEIFKKEANEVHKGQYLYDKMIYVKNNIPVTITCPIHGDFLQTPSNHLMGKGCPECARKKKGERKLDTIETFIEKAEKVHGEKYAYNKGIYVNSTTKICITCPEHGDFWQTPSNHLSGKGCPECADRARKEKKSSNTEEFKAKAEKIHKGKYSYDKSVYINARTPLTITCRVHGDFLQTPNKHLMGGGCPICAGNKKMTTEEFLKKAMEVHGDEYVYDGEYVDNRTPMKITCRIHGDFWQTPGNHLKGCKCPKCAGGVKYTKEDFIQKAEEVHGDDYIYDDVVYVNNQTPVNITCRKHGKFSQTPAHHLQGAGCPVCGGSQKLSTETFIQKARVVHKDEYIYTDTDYINNNTKVAIICRKHGKFWQTPSSHLSGHGCPECYGIKPYNKESYKTRVRGVHDDKYIYNNLDYVSSSSIINITCPIHGDFKQNASEHLQGKGCPICGHHLSLSENEMYTMIVRLIGKENVVKGNRKVLNGKEIDICAPFLKFGIEYNGLRWHSEQFNKDKNYHLNKTELAESKGYHLIQIFEDEWLEHKDIVLNKIRHFLGKDIDRPVVGARKCLVKTVSKADAEVFLTTYHIQGFVASTTYYGAFYEDKLVGVMTFKQEKPNEWNLTRFATDTSYRLPGLASKIFKQFVKDYNPIEVKTFLDRRWSHGDVNVYDRMGFKLVETLPPDYRYVVGNQRIHKFNFRKHILNKKYGLPLSMTEKEITEKLGFYRIWDCGLYKYVWRKQSEDSH